MASDRTGTGLAVVRISLGIFFLFEGLAKLAWLIDAGPLTKQLTGWLENAVPAGRWYLETVAIPGVPLFARLVPLGEMAAALALILGVWTRLAAGCAFLMVLNYHVASSRLFEYRFLTFGYGLPVLGPLLGLAIGAKRLPWSLRK